MKILIIGGSGTIGKKLVSNLEKSNEVIVASRKSENYSVDISDVVSINSLLLKVGKVDAIICLAGEAKWDAFNELTEDDFYIGIRSKLMGQVNLVRLAEPYLSKNGSITLSTGILADVPVPHTTSAAMVNGAIHSFVKATKVEQPRLSIRVNAVSLELVEDAYEKYKDYFIGHTPISMEKAIDAYLKSIESGLNGEIIKVYE